MQKILIIEDHKQLADLLRQFLQKKGLDADIAADATGVPRTLSEQHYDLLLVDERIAQIGGIALCRTIRQSPSGTTVPIILMTGSAKDLPGVEQSARGLGLHVFPTKPFSSDMLYALISSSLSARTVSSAPAAAPHEGVQKQQPSIKGDLDKTPFEQILLYLLRKKGTGVLTVRRGPMVRKFFFIDGAPIDLELAWEDDHFGNHLARKNLISAAELQAYAERRGKEEFDPRSIFIKMGCLTPERFQEENRLFLQEALVECFSWRTGSALFEWGTSFLTTAPVASAFLPSLFYQGFKTHLSPARISAFMEEKGPLYIAGTTELYEYQNHLAVGQADMDVLGSIDGRKTCSQIVYGAESGDADVLLYTLDYLKALTFSATPIRAAVSPPFPVRGRGHKTPQQQETLEDLGGELNKLAVDMDGLGSMKTPQPSSAETAGLSALESALQKQWDAIKDKNYYEIFGMTQNTFSFDKLKKAYFEVTRTFGPEKFFASSSQVMALAEELLSKVSNAYTTLTNVVSKENYDELLAQQIPSGEEERLFYAKVQFQSGKVLLEQGQFESAEKTFTTCLTIEADKPEYLAHLAFAVYHNPANKGNPAAVKRAKDLVNKSLKMGKLAIAYALKGSILLDEGLMSLAEAEFNKALKLNPNNKIALKNLELISQKREAEKKGLFQRMFK